MHERAESGVTSRGDDAAHLLRAPQDVEPPGPEPGSPEPSTLQPPVHPNGLGGGEASACEHGDGHVAAGDGHVCCGIACS